MLMSPGDKPVCNMVTPIVHRFNERSSIWHHNVSRNDHILLDLTLSARHCVGVGAGQPVEEALDFKIPEAPLVPVLLGLIPRHLAAELDQAVAERDVRLIQEILLSAGEIALRERFPFGGQLFGKRGWVDEDLGC